jgi:hypothetical protein
MKLPEIKLFIKCLAENDIIKLKGLYELLSGEDYRQDSSFLPQLIAQKLLEM